MAKMRVGFIGTGKKKERLDKTGFAMAYHHAAAYRALENCELAACADIVRENAQAFAAVNGVPKVYEDSREMLAQEGLDIVSICTRSRFARSAKTNVHRRFSTRPRCGVHLNRFGSRWAHGLRNLAGYDDGARQRSKHIRLHRDGCDQVAGLHSGGDQEPPRTFA